MATKNSKIYRPTAGKSFLLVLWNGLSPFIIGKGDGMNDTVKSGYFLQTFSKFLDFMFAFYITYVDIGIGKNFC